jgi:hypothetical protein
MRQGWEIPVLETCHSGSPEPGVGADLAGEHTRMDVGGVKIGVGYVQRLHLTLPP